VGATQDFGNELTDDFRPEAFLGIDGKWKVAGNQNVVYSVYYYPSLEDLNDGRLRTQLGYSIDIDRAANMAVKLGIEHEYERRTTGEVNHNDWKYFANLLMKF
jgi:hypothetical protein